METSWQAPRVFQSLVTKVDVMSLYFHAIMPREYSSATSMFPLWVVQGFNMFGPSYHKNKLLQSCGTACCTSQNKPHGNLTDISYTNVFHWLVRRPSTNYWNMRARINIYLFSETANHVRDVFAHKVPMSFGLKPWRRKLPPATWSLTTSERLMAHDLQELSVALCVKTPGPRGTLRSLKSLAKATCELASNRN